MLYDRPCVNRCEVEAILSIYSSFCFVLFYLTPAFNFVVFYFNCDIMYVCMHQLFATYVSYVLWVCSFIFNSVSCVIQFFSKRIKKISHIWFLARKKQQQQKTRKQQSKQMTDGIKCVHTDIISKYMFKSKVWNNGNI